MGNPFLPSDKRYYVAVKPLPDRDFFFKLGSISVRGPSIILYVCVFVVRACTYEFWGHKISLHGVNKQPGKIPRTSLIWLPSIIICSNGEENSWRPHV